jgi:hypothetical protein
MFASTLKKILNYLTFLFFPFNFVLIFPLTINSLHPQPQQKFLSRNQHYFIETSSTTLKINSINEENIHEPLEFLQ